MLKNLRIFSFLPSFLPVLKKHKTVLLIALFFVGGFFMRTVIAEDYQNETELALLGSIEERIDTKLTTMENEKNRQDNILEVADEIEHLAGNIPELSTETLVEMRAIALGYVDELTEITNRAAADKKAEEFDTEEKLLEISEDETELRSQIALSSVRKVEQILIKRLEDINRVKAKRNEEIFSAAPSELQQRVRAHFNGDSAEDAAEQQTEEN